MKSIDVVTPGALPLYTYYDRDDLGLEWRLLEAVETPGMIASVSGPSKSGKTVLCESVVGKGKMLLVSGGGIRTEDDFWRKIRQAARVPREQTVTETKGKTAQVEAGVEVEAGLFGFAKAKSNTGGSLGTSNGIAESAVFDSMSGVQLLEAIRDAGATLVIDDFHYISLSIQRTLAELFKEAARRGLNIVIISVTHRSDEAIRANPDLRGRVIAVDIPFWEERELAVIAKRGFPLLGVDIKAETLNRFTKESLTSPQLMQAICLQFCRKFGIEDSQQQVLTLDLSESDCVAILKSTAKLADCRTAYDIIVTGPKTRGTERGSYLMRDGQVGDIYQVLLRALAIEPPIFTLPYAEIKSRLELLVPIDPPRGVGIVQALGQIQKAVVDKLGEDRVLDWDEEKQYLEIPDPYFLYFLRWGR